MSSILGIVGSLRSESVNGRIARAAAEVVDELTVHDVSQLPLYHGDEEAAGPPAAAVALHDAAGAADGVVFFSPEYNSSFPAVTKNVIDWLSRPPRHHEGTAVTMITATPGRRAGRGVREHFATVMAHQPVRVFETLGLGSYGERLGPDGHVLDATVEEVAQFLARFAAFAESDA